MPNGEKYVCIARTVEKGVGKHGMFKSLLSIGLGCQSKYAKDFVYADSLNLNDINLNARTRFLDVIDLNFSSRYDPYITNNSFNNNVNKFELFENGRLARFMYLDYRKISNNNYF